MSTAKSITNDGDKDADQLRIEVFMAKMRSDKQTIPTEPTIPSLEIRTLRASLMLEECLETIRDGLGLEIAVDGGNLPSLRAAKFGFYESGEPSLIQIADGLGDKFVVDEGTASACGIAMCPIKRLVMANNLTKFAPGHSFNELGKLVKPPNFVGPFSVIATELLRQGANYQQIEKELKVLSK